MKLAAVIVPLFLALNTAALIAETPPAEEAVKTAIKNFEPLWRPPADALRGWVIGIDPALVGADQDSLRCNDLNLITAHHLRHFVQKAGGSVVLSRADDSRVADGSALADRAVRIIRDAGCDVCVSIRCNPEGRMSIESTVVDGSGASARLVEQLWQQFEHKTTDRQPCKSELLHALAGDENAAGVITCEVALPGPAPMGVETRKNCRAVARAIFDAIAAVRAENADDTREGKAPAEPPREGQAPAEPQVDVVAEAEPQSPTHNTRAAGLARRIWPAGDLPLDRADWFCRRFAELSITNRSLVFFDVHAQAEQGGVALTGRTNYPQIVEGLLKTLHAAGIEVVKNEVRALPNRDSLGDKLFGVCQAPQALTFNRPSDSAGLQTQLLLGEPLHLLDREDGYYLLLAGDGYWGWVACDAVRPMTADEFDTFLKRPRAALLDDLDYAGGRIPRGAILPLAADREGPGEGNANTEIDLLLPNGSTASAPAKIVRLIDTPDGTVSARLIAALEMLYTPYVFGGRSPVGLDCSGMVTNVCARVGGSPSRDAWQQAIAGQLSGVPWRRTDIRPGDQVFFIDDFGKVYHTGVAINHTHVVHASPPCVQIGSINADAKLHDQSLDRNFFMAKRP